VRFVSRLPGGWWGLIFPTVSGLLAVILAASGVPLGQAWIGYATLALLGLGWFAVGARAVDDGPLSLPVTVVIILATALLCSLNPAMASVQVLAYPYAWSASDKRIRIVAANCGIAVAVVIGFTAHGWLGGGGLLDWFWSGLATGAASLTFSFAMGTWISSIARQAATRAVLQARLDAMSEELAQAHREAGAAAERERFAHEVHDTLTQTLTAVVMLTERAGDQLGADPEAAASTIGIAERTARQALAETRSLIAEGRGTQIGADGLAARIDRLCTRFGEETGVQVRTEMAGPLDALDRADQVVVLRCLQETLANVRKHARASAVTVELNTGPDGTLLAVTDDGVGFPDDVEAAAARGYGLSGMSSRLALANGSLTITTGSDGTRVSIHLPAATGRPQASSSQEGRQP